ncbi:type III transcriptional regulator HrpR [Pseudomonas synxantha]|uniref:Type III transcriptional regulator HrpR n=1 Tax=Pseudomonas synxantha TaxID=47883 RepID=A0A3G7UC07_9PSED|nr:sigma 54-interacting transcriptional regulator [Pseudomonas synxantha]AZE56880.1 type III transcriptional regulator HrpR [Pseudomonas synxantha]
MLNMLEAHLDQRDLNELVDKIAPLPLDIFVYGQTGTGKDRLARRVHERSGRTGSFVPINCAAIPESLAESLLFGTVSGVFTGAVRSRPGYFEESNHGTLYLDEIDSMPMHTQAKLLRVIESRGVERLGSTEFIPLNLRVIASAQSSLNQLIKEQRFRSDLFYRLNAISIHLPPLHTQKASIIPTFMKMVQNEAHLLGFPSTTPPSHLLNELINYTWPGNLRELRSAARRFVLGLAPLEHENPMVVPSKLRLKDQLRQVEKSLIEDALKRHNHSMTAVIDELGIPSRTLYHRLKRLKITPPHKTAPMYIHDD